MLCDRWRGTPETPSSASCTQQCPSPAQMTLQFPAPRPHPATLQLHPPLTVLMSRGISPNHHSPHSLSADLQILNGKPNTRQSKQSNEAKILLCFYFLLLLLLLAQLWAFLSSFVVFFICLSNAYVDIGSWFSEVTVNVLDWQSCSIIWIHINNNELSRSHMPITVSFN